jgi:Putative type VII ESX secretion system translocon, EccE
VSGGDRDGRGHRVRYRFPPLERRGVIAGWRGGQIATVATGLVLAVLAVRAGPSALGVVVAVVTVAAAVALAFWPVAGRTGEQWLPLVARWAWAGAAGRRRQLHPGPRDGVPVAVEGGREPPRLGACPSPTTRGPLGGGRTVFDGFVVEAVPLDPARPSAAIGIVVDRPGRALTAVLALRGNSFALLGPEDQDARVGAWARALASLAREGCAVHRVQWVETCLPDDGASVHGYPEERAVLGADTPAGATYRALVDESSPVTRRHQVLLALTLRPARAARMVRAAGGGLHGAGAVLAREVDALGRALEGAEVTVDGVLGAGALGAVLAGPWRRAAPGVPQPTGERPPGTPWPMAVEPCWDAVRTDGVWHAVYWIAEWPRVEVTPDFLGPLLFAPLRRSLSLVMEPVGPLRAARQVAQSRTADLADGELRRRGGFLVTARHARERERVEARDAELADGHAQFRFSGYLTVTADSRDELTAAASALEQAAGQARLEVRLLYGQQDAALLCGIPVGRGLA